MEEGGLTAEQVAEVLDLPDGVDPLLLTLSQLVLMQQKLWLLKK